MLCMLTEISKHLVVKEITDKQTSNNSWIIFDLVNCSKSNLAVKKIIHIPNNFLFLVK